MRYLKRVIMAAVAATTIFVMGATVDAAIVAGDSRNTVVLTGDIQYGDAAQMNKELGNLDRIHTGQYGLHLYINSTGGMGAEIMTIIGVIDRFQKGIGGLVYTYNYGFAFSAGALLFLRGDIRIMHETATVMFHDAYFMGQNGLKVPKNDPAVPAWAWKRLEYMNKWSRAYIKKRCKLSDSLIDAEKFMQADEAVKYNVCTKIIK